MNSRSKWGSPRTGVSPSSARSLRRLSALALLSLVCSVLCAAPAWPQVPDNRGLRLDPEDAVSPAYRDTLDRRDWQRLEQATESGGSFISTLQGTGRAPGEGAPEGAAADRAPEDGWEGRRATARETVPPAETPRPVYETDLRREARAGEADSGLAAMIGVLLESWTRPPRIARVRYAPVQGETAPTGPATAPGPERTPPEGADLPEIAAGEGLYARTLYAVDSDYPGPVVLELLQPPLAGAVVHGGFERVRQRLVLRLTSLTWQGRTVPVDAWAVDPDCACYGIEGEVDRHFVSRVLLPAAARFAEGFLTAIAMPARTLTFDDGRVLQERAEAGSEEALHAGLGAAARTLGDVLTADAPKETTLRIPRNTPLVVMVARRLAAPPRQPASGFGSREETDAGP